MGRTSSNVNSPSSATLSMLVAGVMLFFMFSAHIASAQNSSTDGTVTPTNNMQPTETTEDTTATTTEAPTPTTSTQTTPTTPTTTEIPIGHSCATGGNCASNLSCITPNNTSTNKTCGCLDGYYYDDSPVSCLPKKAKGQACSNASECISNLSCVYSKCGCDEDFFYNPSSPSCSPKLDHGVACQSAGPTDQCKLPHTVCLPSFKQPSTTKCLCDSGFYWGSSSGSCMSVANLNITASVGNRGTTTVTFSWSQVPARSDVSYSITWGNSNTWNASNSGATVTGLEPGTSYNFVVVTSLPADDNYAPVTANQSQALIWTKPEKPGPVTVSYVDNSTYTYEVTFVKSNGSASLYTMEVSMGGSVTERQSNTTTTMYFTTLKPATAYTYSLWSENGIKERSDPVTGSFNTTPEVPGPVSGLNSMGVQSHTANVTWQPPSNPNGIITGYLVEVQNTTGCVYYITVDQVVLNDINLPSCSLTNANITSSNNVYNLELPHLKPYRDYTVMVRAFNEKGLGTRSTVTFQTDISAPNDISELTLNSERNESTQKVNLNIAWTPGEQTGPTDYYILVEALGLDSGGSNQSSSPYIVTGYSNNTYVKHDVLAYWRYNISVWARTDKGNSSLKFAKNISTVETNPGAVQNLNVTQDSQAANVVTLTFECPGRMSRNGIIEKFVINQTLLNPQTSGEDEKFNYTHIVTGTPCSSQYKVPAQNIKVERNYSFFVMTVNNKYEGGVSNYSRFYVQPKVPQLINLTELFKVDALVKLQDGSATELTKISTDVCYSCLTDVRWGRVVNVGLLVCVKDVGKCTATGRKKRSGPEFTSFKSWRDAKEEGFISEYRTTPDNWIPTTNGNNIYTKFVVGENTNCSEADVGYCNGPLLGGHREYFISVIMCTTAGCTIYREHKPFETYAPDEPSHVGAIVGGVLGGLALVAVIGVIIFLVWHFRKRNGRSPGRHPVAGNEGSKEIIRKRPVKMRDFNDHVTRFHKDSNLLFQDEFESIRTVSESFKNTCDESKREQNRVKNRYADILPYDHSRVKLDILSDDDDTNDFINANYIPGYNSVREFIATQGPMYSTIPDFWKMVWEQKCKMIVMLSDLTEAGKRKVDLYWPESLNEPINYGTVVVEMTNFSQLNKYIIRIFKLIKGEETRKVTHYFLPGWPDFGAAISFDDVLGFVKAVRQEVTPANEGPIVVHCSAGVGRSGTFIALDYFAQFVEEHSLDDSIDVFDFVLQMRKNRTKMVQVEMQYIFIYDSINKLIQNKIKSEEEKLYENLSPGNGIYENFKQQEENIYANSTVKDDKYVYNNEAFEPDFGQSQKSDKPITEL